MKGRQATDWQAFSSAWFTGAFCCVVVALRRQYSVYLRGSWYEVYRGMLMAMLLIVYNGSSIPPSAEAPVRILGVLGAVGWKEQFIVKATKQQQLQ